MNILSEVESFTPELKRLLKNADEPLCPDFLYRYIYSGRTYADWGNISRHRMKKREASYTGIATGTTIDEIIDTDNDGNEIFFPVISYTVNGFSYQIQSDTGYGGRSKVPIGAELKVRYHPEDPASVLIEKGAYFFSTLLLLMGPLLIIWGALLLALVYFQSLVEV